MTGSAFRAKCDFDEAKLINPDGRALQAARITVGGDLLCRHGFVSKGEVNLDGAAVAWRLSMDGATLENRRAYALHAARLSVRGEVRCSTKFVAEGEIHILNARFEGALVLNGARIYNANHPSTAPSICATRRTASPTVP